MASEDEAGLPGNTQKISMQQSLSTSPLMDLPDHVWDLIWERLENKGSRLALCLASARFFKLWAGDLLKTVNGAEINLPVGRFVTDSIAAEAVQRSGLQNPSVTFLMQHCDLRWLLLLETFLRRAAGSGAASIAWTPFVTQHGRGPVHRCSAPSCSPPLRLTCPSGFRPVHEVHSGGEGTCLGHLPTSCKTGDARQICCLLSSWGDVGKNGFFFQPADVRLRLHGTSASGTAAAFLELRAVRPVMRPQLIPKDPSFA